MGGHSMKLAVLTSSRADYGIYLPLLKSIKEDPSIILKIIAFGSHCSARFGNTVDLIEEDGFEVAIKIDNLLEGDSPKEIAKSYSNTLGEFAEFWSLNNDFDWVLCLGDRFEMAAAVNAGIPFGINFAHLYAGDTTTGAIDNIYRHQISLVAKIHFVSLIKYAERVHQLIGNEDTTCIIGALSLENLKHIHLLSKEEFKLKWNVDLSIPTLLMTIHPETVNYENNINYIEQLKLAIPPMLEEFQLVITMPNADTFGSLYRNFFKEIEDRFNDKVFLIENFGTQSYFTCMKYADMLIGNTSSGIVEAASFNKYVINLGDRQDGRESSSNLVTVPFDASQILIAFNKLKGKEYFGDNIYFQNDSVSKFLNFLKSK